MEIGVPQPPGCGQQFGHIACSHFLSLFRNIQGGTYLPFHIEDTFTEFHQNSGSMTRGPDLSRDLRHVILGHDPSPHFETGVLFFLNMTEHYATTASVPLVFVSWDRHLQSQPAG